jgi:hypothetical protein
MLTLWERGIRREPHRGGREDVSTLSANYIRGGLAVVVVTSDNRAGPACRSARPFLPVVASVLRPLVLTCAPNETCCTVQWHVQSKKGLIILIWVLPVLFTRALSVVILYPISYNTGTYTVANGRRKRRPAGPKHQTRLSFYPIILPHSFLPHYRHCTTHKHSQKLPPLPLHPARAKGGLITLAPAELDGMARA